MNVWEGIKWSGEKQKDGRWLHGRGYVYQGWDVHSNAGESSPYRWSRSAHVWSLKLLLTTAAVRLRPQTAVSRDSAKSEWNEKNSLRIYTLSIFHCDRLILSVVRALLVTSTKRVCSLCPTCLIHFRPRSLVWMKVTYINTRTRDKYMQRSLRVGTARPECFCTSLLICLYPRMHIHRAEKVVPQYFEIDHHVVGLWGKSMPR